MRTLLALLPLCLLALAGAAQASWTFAPRPVCTLHQAAGGTEVTVTYDPATQLYRIDLTRPGGWPDVPRFALGFTGPRSLTISTDRHQRSADGQTLSVTDTGFGNVLDGLAFNETATALAGAVAQPFPLAGAAEPVAAFRACTEALAV